MAVVSAATGLDDGGLQPTPDPELAPPLSRFAANLRRARERAHLSQEALAAEAGMHRTALSRLETCERPSFGRSCGWLVLWASRRQAYSEGSARRGAASQSVLCRC
ncbi:MAG: helix-turn-helix transcriptional regulator [Solirubrobacteraceae bacterium]